MNNENKNAWFDHFGRYMWTLALIVTACTQPAPISAKVMPSPASERQRITQTLSGDDLVHGIEGVTGKASFEFDFSKFPDGPLPDEVAARLKPDIGTLKPGWNNELQTNTDMERNVKIQNGKLIIEALNESTGTGKEQREFTSARLEGTTVAGQNELCAQYGLWEADMTFPDGNGAWSAFWFLPQEENNPLVSELLRQQSEPWMEQTSGAWQIGGEIDFEHLAVNPTIVYSTAHTFDSITSGNNSSSKETSVPDATTKEHTYGMAILPGRIVWLIDGNIVNETTAGAIKPDSKVWPFDAQGVSFCPILNIAVGGEWNDFLAKNAGIEPVDHNQESLGELQISRISFYKVDSGR